MKNKIVVGSIVIALIIIFGINLLKFIPPINLISNVTWLGIQKLVICIAFSILMFEVFSYSWLTYAISFYTYLGICCAFRRIFYPALNKISTLNIILIIYLLAFILTFITFYILKRCKVNLRKHESVKSHIKNSNYKKDRN